MLRPTITEPLASGHITRVHTGIHFRSLLTTPTRLPRDSRNIASSIPRITIGRFLHGSGVNQPGAREVSESFRGVSNSVIRRAVGEIRHPLGETEGPLGEIQGPVDGNAEGRPPSRVTGLRCVRYAAVGIRIPSPSETGSESHPCRRQDQNPMPPISSAPGMAGAGFFSGLSATTASVVRNRAAIDAAFCSAERVTLTGSLMPAASRSS